METTEFYIVYWRAQNQHSETIPCPNLAWGLDMIQRLEAGYPLENVDDYPGSPVYPIAVHLVQILKTVEFKDSSKLTKKGTSIDK